MPQPVHLHGYRFWVMSQVVYEEDNTTTTNTINTTSSTSTDTTGNATTTEDDLELPEISDENGFTRLRALALYAKDKLNRNFFHPIMKDTIMIPPGGYVVIRFWTSNTGKTYRFHICICGNDIRKEAIRSSIRCETLSLILIFCNYCYIYNFYTFYFRFRITISFISRFIRMYVCNLRI